MKWRLILLYDFHKSARLLIWNDKVVLGYMSLPYVFYEIERDCSFSHKCMIYCHRLLYKFVIIVAHITRMTIVRTCVYKTNKNVVRTVCFWNNLH
jgi:hypothetical protein